MVCDEGMTADEGMRAVNGLAEKVKSCERRMDILENSSKILNL
jgi:hypothetical protein